jgi:3-hydroxybutyryl-CoA dehydrogenase
MALVELGCALTTSDETMQEIHDFVSACGKTGVTVKDQSGFVVNALLFPYLNNAVKLFDAGVASRDDIDTAMKGGCNFPMGPLELLDLVGLDVSLAILDALHKEFGDPNYAPALLLRRMVAAERLGRKSGSGFYDYSN